MGQCAWSPGVRAPEGEGGTAAGAQGAPRPGEHSSEPGPPRASPAESSRRDAEAKVRASCPPHRVSAGFWSRKVDPCPGLGGSSGQAERAPRTRGCRSLLATGLHSPSVPASLPLALLPFSQEPLTPGGSPHAGHVGTERSPGRRSSGSWGLRPAVGRAAPRGRAPGEHRHTLCASFLTHTRLGGTEAS